MNVRGKRSSHCHHILLACSFYGIIIVGLCN